MNQVKDCLVVYRGPMETSRIIFILQALQKCYQQIRFVWVFPGVYTAKTQAFFEQFARAQGLQDARVLNHRMGDVISTIRSIKPIVLQSPGDDLVLIGVSAAIFPRWLPVKGRIIWFINGIPDEEGLRSIFHRTLRSIKWRIFSFCVKPGLIVTVSSRMSKYISRYFPGVRFINAPTCVDTSVFTAPRDGPVRKNGVCAYLGTGAPWQAIGNLSLLWQALYKSNPALRFRVVSRDPRTRILGDGLPAHAVEFLQSNNGLELSEFLQGSEVGFLLRDDLLVNRVSFPTKFGELVASGCWMVVSDIDWDVRDYMQEFNIGLLLNNPLPVHEKAAAILAYREAMDWPRLAEQTRLCANRLSRAFWVPRVVEAIQDLEK